MRPLSSAARASIYAQETDVVWLFLLTISHEDMPVSIRVVNNQTDIVSNGETYVAYPFTINLPQEFESQMPHVELIIDNVDRTIVQSIRRLTSAPTITLSVITDSDLDQVEAGPFNFTLNEVTYTALTVSGQLAFEPILDEQYPKLMFTPVKFPGLF